MGNRAVITNKKKEIGVYLHWNGGRDSIEAFLKYCELREFRSPDTQNYGWARLCQVIANFFGGDGLSIGVDKYENLPHPDFLDNGVYIIEGWKIVDRDFGTYEDEEWEEQQEHPLLEMLIGIDQAQPTREQIFKDLVKKDVKKLLNKMEGKE